MRHYSVVLNTSKGYRRSIRINNPTVGLPTADIEAAVEQIIQNDVFDQEKGYLDSLSRMELTTIERVAVL